jgi:hypothetical protein
VRGDEAVAQPGQTENADHRHHPGAQGRRLGHLIDIHPGRHQHDRRHRHHHDLDHDRHAERAFAPGS